MQINSTINDEAKEYTFKSYSYQNGKMQEKTITAKEVYTPSIQKMDIPLLSENYNNIQNSLKAFRPFPGNKMFGETYDVMKDFYEGNLSKEEVREIYKTYCTSMIGTPENSKTASQQVTYVLEDMYEYFSRANTRNAVHQNNVEGDKLGCGRSADYYNSDYYYKCKEMQELFQEITDEFSTDFGIEKIDYKKVEENTRFTLDGGITFNGVWNFSSMQHKAYSHATNTLLDENAEPPENFIYVFQDNYFDSEQDNSINLKSNIEKLLSKKTFSQKLTLQYSETGNIFTAGKSNLLNKDKFSEKEMTNEELYESAKAFLESFHLYRGSGSYEFLFIGK